MKWFVVVAIAVFDQLTTLVAFFVFIVQRFVPTGGEDLSYARRRRLRVLIVIYVINADRSIVRL